MTDPDPDKLPQALTALRAGAITMSEAARYVGMTRQAMWERIQKAGIDPQQTRDAYLKRLWARLSNGRLRG